MKIQTERFVTRPVEDVFAVFTDLDGAAERIRGIQKLEVLTEGPVGKGTRFRETRIMFRREATEEMEITDFRPNESYAIGAESCGCVYRTEFRFSPNGSGTQVQVEMDARPVSFLAKLMSPLGRLMAGSMKKCFDQDLDDLKAALEQGETAVPSV